MPKKSKKDAIELKASNEGALIELLDGIMVFVDILRKNKNIRKRSPELGKILDLIAENSESIKKMIEMAAPIMPDAIKVVANLLNQATKILRQFKMDTTIGNALNALSTFFPQIKPLRKMSDEKLLTEIEKMAMSSVDEVRDSASKLLLGSRPKDLSDLQGLANACVQFANLCKDKLLNIFKKVEQTMKVDESEELEVRKPKRAVK